MTRQSFAEQLAARPVVVFDLDDTLYLERDFAFSGFRAVGRFAEEKFGLAGVYEKARALFESGRRGNILNLALEGAPASAPGVEELVRVFREHEPAIQFCPDVVPAFQALRTNRKFGLITDGFLGVQQRKARALGLADLVDSMVFSDAFGREHWKPHPMPFLKLMEGLGARGDQCVYVGDNPIKDFISARKLGFLTARVRRPEGEHFSLEPATSEHAADFEIQDLAQLVP
jgi:putative hydrolase of the HAD superfamily